MLELTSLANIATLQLVNLGRHVLEGLDQRTGINSVMGTSLTVRKFLSTQQSARGIMSSFFVPATLQAATTLDVMATKILATCFGEYSPSWRPENTDTCYSTWIIRADLGVSPGPPPFCGLLNISELHVQNGIQAFARFVRPECTRLHLRELQSQKFSRRSMHANLSRKVPCSPS